MAKEESAIDPVSVALSVKSPRPKPKKILPTERITFPKQLDILRAYAIASGVEKKPVNNSDVAVIVNLASPTVSLSNAFFVDAGFLTKAEGGYLPSDVVLAFSRAYEWDAELAPEKLAPLIEQTWFAVALLPRAKFRSIDDNEAIVTLAEAAEADTSYKPQLRMLIEYLEKANLLQRVEGNLLRAGKRLATFKTQVHIPNVGASTGDAVKPLEVDATPPVIDKPMFGGIQFDISVKVNMAELAGWSPERITAFMTGLAQVIAAKGKVEGVD